MSASLEARLERLEHDNRRLRRALLAFVALVVTPLLLAYVPANDKLEAGEFVVRDKGGAVRARLWVDDKGKARLLLRDADGKSEATLTAAEGASLSLGDADGKGNVVLSASSAKGVLSYESDGKSKAVLHKPKDPLDPLDVQDPWAWPE